MMLRACYSWLFYLATPILIARLFWRSRKAPAYRQRWQERFGFYPAGLPQQVVWFHAVSVGEAESLFPLLRHLQQHHPEARLLVTTTTPTGADRVQTVLQHSATHVYLPYDQPCAVNRFLRHFKPRLAVIVETEIWPNLYAACAAHKVPLYLVNARLSEKSARGYRKMPALLAPALAAVKRIATQTAEDTQRFLAIGASAGQLLTLGNIKFDMQLSADAMEIGAQLKTRLFGSRLVWLAASTHRGEEKILIDIYRRIKPKLPDLLLLLAPRHPERFPDVKKLCEQQGLSVVTRSSNAPCLPATDIFLLDSIGELKLFYIAADIAFIGGSLVPIGGHNALEAALAGAPIVFGPYMANFNAIAEGLLNAQAAVQCRDRDALAEIVLALSANAGHRKKLVEQARLFVLQHQGAVGKIYALLAPYLVPAVSYDQTGITP